MIHESRAASLVADAHVVVLSGGRSGEREVSLRTSRAVAGGLRERTDDRGPKSVDEVEIAADGAWILGNERLAPLAVLARFPRDAVWFLGLHGGAGEDGTIQGLLASAGVRHTGSGVGASALCMNKSWTRAVLSASGISVAPGVRFEATRWRDERRSLLVALGTLSRTGWAVKPESGGSSVATFLVEDEGGLVAALDRATAVSEDILVEAIVRGREATCGVLGNRGSALVALTPVEIVPKPGRFFDYDEKYAADGAEEHCPPRNLSPDAQARICELARRAHAVAGCDGYSRVDFMVPVDEPGLEGEPVALEINTLPGMTDRSLLPRAARERGMSFRDLVLEILRLALERDGRSG